MPKRTLLRSETGLAPPREPIPGAITYEQMPWYATSGQWAWWNSPTRIAVVGACVRLIAHQISVLPAKVTRDGQPVADQPGWLRNPAPNVYDWLGDAVEALCVSLLMRGNAYLVSTGRGSNDYPLGWVVANPDQMRIERENGRKLYYWGERTRLHEEEVCHVRWLAIPDSDYGVGPLAAAMDEVLAASALSRYGSDLAINGGMPFGVLSTEQRLRADQAKGLREQWATTGTARRGVLVLDSGLSYEQLQLSPREMALLEVLEFNARSICSVFGVQPWLVNVPTTDGLTYNTAEAQMGALLSLTLDPVLSKIEGTISYKFLPGDRALSFDRDKFRHVAANERMQAHAIAISAGIYSADEARAMENIPARQTPVGASVEELEP